MEVLIKHGGAHVDKTVGVGPVDWRATRKRFR